MKVAHIRRSSFSRDLEDSFVAKCAEDWREIPATERVREAAADFIGKSATAETITAQRRVIEREEWLRDHGIFGR